MQKKYVAIAAIGMLMMGVTSAKAEGKNGVAAVVNGKEIKVSDIKQGYEENKQASGANISFDDFYNQAVEIFVNAEVVSQAAEKDKIKETAEYKNQLKAIGDEIARRIYLEKAVSKKVTDAEVDKLYKQYKDEFKNEKEVKAKHILVEDEKTANDVIKRLKKGEDFEKIAKEVSKDQADLGYFRKNMMVPEFGEAAFAMKKGTYSQKPVKTQFGYHVILLEDIRDTKALTKAEAEPQLKAMLMQNAIAETIGDLREKGKVTVYDLDGKTK